MQKVWEGVKKAFLNMLTKIAKAVMHLIEKLGGEIETVLNEFGETVAKNLEDMTIAELRVYAKQLEISLEGKRVKQEIIDIIEKHLKGV